MRAISAPSVRLRLKAWLREETEPRHARSSVGRKRAGAPRRSGNDRPLRLGMRATKRLLAPQAGEPSCHIRFEPGRTPSRPEENTSASRTGSLPELSVPLSPPVDGPRHGREAQPGMGDAQGIRCFEASAPATASKLGQDAFVQGAPVSTHWHTQTPTRLDFYRARVVDGLGKVIHERSVRRGVDG